VRVRVETGKDKLLLSIRSHYKIEDLNSALRLKKGKRIRKKYIIPTNSGIKLGGTEFKVYGIRIIPTRDSAIYIGGKRLRGTVDIIRTKDCKLLVVNRLDVEKYLYGVLYNEVPQHWPMEALKAQGVAARTFVLHRAALAGDKDYDVTNDIYSQVYRGRSRESRNARKAVDATKGETLSWKGEILPAYYHAICGGYTENAEVVFGASLKPLRGRRCVYCRGARGMNWKASFSYRGIEKALTKYGIKANGMNYIVEGKRSRSGRLETIKIRGRDGVSSIDAYKFRLAIGPNKIRSTNFTLRITPKGIIFRGKGWGHGVGMCQWGAFGMAKKRFKYKQILAHYYPGAKIE